MNYHTYSVLAILLGCTALAPAAPSAYDDLARVMLQSDKMKETIYKSTDKVVEKAKSGGLPPAGQEELRAALHSFFDDLIRDGVLVKPMANSFRKKLTEEEAQTFTAFLQTSVGKKLINGSINISLDKEQAMQSIREEMQSRAGELAVIITNIAEKYRINLK